jgi:hypothetical protein
MYLMAIRITVFAFMMASLMACGGLPKPPAVNPWVLQERKLTVIPCNMTDPKNFRFSCDGTKSEMLNPAFDGYFMVSPREIQAWRAWGKDISQNYECKKK